MFTVRHTSYSGTSGLPEGFEDLTPARAECAHRLHRLRRAGYPVAVLKRGECWEVREPEGCVMVPDACGTLALRHVTFECAECGSGYETRDDARACCADDADDYCMEGE